jgi:hypothetical protein
MFKIIGGKGFHLTFKNGNTISVQFGAGNYCDNYNDDIIESMNKTSCESETAEVATWTAGGEWNLKKFLPEATDDVHGYMSADEVLDLMNKVAGR